MRSAFQPGSRPADASTWSPPRATLLKRTNWLTATVSRNQSRGTGKASRRPSPYGWRQSSPLALRCRTSSARRRRLRRAASRSQVGLTVASGHAPSIGHGRSRVPRRSWLDAGHVPALLAPSFAVPAGAHLLSLGSAPRSCPQGPEDDLGKALTKRLHSCDSDSTVTQS